MQINLKRNVPASPRDAFATLADVRAWPLIIGSIRSVELLTPEPVTEGSKLRVSRFLFGRETTQLFEVSRLEPPRQMRLSVEDPDIDFDLDHVIDGIFGGGSRIMLIFRARPQTQVGKAALPFMSPFMGITLRDELEQDLLDLATAITLRSAQEEPRAHAGHQPKPRT
ncbi:hypothetical protein HYPP_02681 [Hyphomicrobium sp. ghe19]|nr:hypothetical protein HYPP_02681 [Hyphomicrobium sp. ghe19]